MAFVVFDDCLMLEVRSGTSKAGNPWCMLRFLDRVGSDVYELMQFGEQVPVCLGLQKGDLSKLRFDVVPDTRDGGVRLQLGGVYPVEGVV